MLTSWHLNEKSREVCINARSTPASLVFTGQETKQQQIEQNKIDVIFPCVCPVIDHEFSRSIVKGAVVLNPQSTSTMLR